MSTFQQTNLVSVKIFVALLSFTLSANILGGCKNSVSVNNNDGEYPDSIDAKFVWRICNESDEYAMENIWVYGFDITDKNNYRDSLAVGVLAPGKCTSYFPGLHEGNQPLWWIIFKENEVEYSIIYLEIFKAVRGLVDSTAIIDTPGKYTYHCTYDSTRPGMPWWVEIERESYH